MFEGCKLAAVVLLLQQAGPPRGFLVSGHGKPKASGL